MKNNLDQNENGIIDKFENDRNNNGIDDKVERDLNNNGIDDELEAAKALEVKSFQEIKPTAEKLQTKDLPFDDFSKLGFTKDRLFNTIPKEDLSELLKLNKTNIIPLDIKQDDISFKVDVKLSLKRNQDNSYSLRVHPFRKEIENKYDLTKAELDELRKGAILEKELQLPGDKQSKKHLIQLDKEINELMTSPAKNKKLEKKLDSLNLSDEQRKQIAAGKQINIKQGGTNFSVQLDLNRAGGLNINNEDYLKNTKLDKGTRLDLAH